jgi:hypothetical protein
MLSTSMLREEDLIGVKQKIVGEGEGGQEEKTKYLESAGFLTLPCQTMDTNWPKYTWKRHTR